MKVNTSGQLYSNVTFETQVNDCRLVGITCSFKPKSFLRNVSEYFSMALGGHFISDFIYIKRPVTVLGNVNVG